MLMRFEPARECGGTCSLADFVVMICTCLSALIYPSDLYCHVTDLSNLSMGYYPASGLRGARLGRASGRRARSRSTGLRAPALLAVPICFAG